MPNAKPDNCQLAASSSGRNAAIALSGMLALGFVVNSPAADLDRAAGLAGTSSPAEWCKLLVPRLPGITSATCNASLLTPSGVRSNNGFPILTRHVPAAVPSEGKAGARNVGAAPRRILLVGGIHGDELTSSAIVFRWMQTMQTPEASQFEWRVAPVLNPDGLLAKKPNRVNAHGVDLNRNFPTPGWHQHAPAYWAKTTRRDPRRFPGHQPLSEPESRWLNDEIESFRPDVIISVHAPFGVLDFDGPSPPPTRFGRLLFNGVGVYPGSLGNYGGRHKNVPVITIELPNALVMPPNAEVRRIWNDMIFWIDHNVATQRPAMTEKRAIAEPL